MTLVSQTCMAARSRPGPSDVLLRAEMSIPRAARLATMTRPARVTEAHLDQRVWRSMRHGLVALRATSRASSRRGMTSRGPMSNDSGSSAYATIATRTAMTGGRRCSPWRCVGGSAPGPAGRLAGHQRLRPSESETATVRTTLLLRRHDAAGYWGEATPAYPCCPQPSAKNRHTESTTRSAITVRGRSPSRDRGDDRSTPSKRVRPGQLSVHRPLEPWPPLHPCDLLPPQQSLGTAPIRRCQPSMERRPPSSTSTASPSRQYAGRTRPGARDPPVSHCSTGRERRLSTRPGSKPAIVEFIHQRAGVASRRSRN